MTNATKRSKSTKPANPPVAKLRLGLISANIWQRRTDNKVFYAVSFERSYKNSQGNWQSTHSYNADDLLILSKLADQAHTEIAMLRAGDNGE
jgi:hypothetical protein